MKKSKIYSYKCDIYPVTLDIICTADCIEQINSTYEYAGDSSIKLEHDTDMYGCTYDRLFNKNTDERTILVVANGYMTPAQMAHEAFHVMNGVLKIVDLDFNFSRNASNEHLSYIISWAVECMCDAQNNDKKCKKKKTK